jgi:hypothetical protein
LDPALPSARKTMRKMAAKFMKMDAAAEAVEQDWRE